MIYLDHHATTFMEPEVVEKMQELLSSFWGNPSSIHQQGRYAKEILVSAREKISKIFSISPNEICFTSSASEAIHTLLSLKRVPKHIVASSIEHAATMAALQKLHERGSKISYIYPNKGYASIDYFLFEKAISSETELIVCMAANNETGAKLPIEALAALAEKRGIPFIVDGVALFGKEPFTLFKGITGFVLSGHKIGGPKGTGIAIIRNSLKIIPLIGGGGQQFQRRAGTEDLIGISGMTQAVSLAVERAENHFVQLHELQKRFEDLLMQTVPNIVIHGKEESRIKSVSCVSFLGVDGENLVIHLDLAGVQASFGAACSSGALSLSPVLSSMQLDADLMQSALRFSFSPKTKEDEIDRAVAIIAKQVKQLRRSFDQFCSY